MPESEQTTLRLLGDWSALGGIAAALGLGALAWWLYWRESRQRPDATAWLLPTLRALAVMLVVLILTGPVLQHERTVRQLGRVVMLVDATQSMELTDEAMPMARKVAVLANLDRLPDEPFFASARDTARYLTQARDLAAEIFDPGTDREPPYLREALREFTDLLEQAYAAYSRVTRDADDAFTRLAATARAAETDAPAPDPETDDQADNNDNDDPNDEETAPERRPAGALAARFRADVIEPATELLERISDDDSESTRTEVVNQLRQLMEPLVVVRRELEGAVVTYVDARTRNPSSEADQRLAAALKEFDETSRWQRMQDLLLTPIDGLVPRLIETQDLELVALAGDEAETLWWQRQAGRQSSGDLQPHFTRLPDASATDLSQPLIDSLGGDTENVAVIVVSDGQHNTDGNPEEIASRLGQLGVPVFTVGIGSEESPPDLAVTDVLVADGVYIEDQVRGEILINDQMPAGGAYEIVIEHGDQTIWEDFLQADGGGERRLEFQFPLRDLVEQELGNDPVQAASLRNVPLDFRVVARQIDAEQQAEIDPARIERVLDNNERDFRVQALTRQRRLLLLDGRPRWESRYIQNLFDRDERWEVNPLIGTIDLDAGRDWQRGEDFGQFPDSREELFTYDLIVFGDVPGEVITEEEAGWLADFVGQRGGGMVFIDGQRRFLADLGHPRLEALLPVEPLSNDQTTGDLPATLSLTTTGVDLPALRIDDRPGHNSTTWESLKAPRWAAPVRALPDATVLAQARFDGDRQIDAIVWRRFGAGQVLYLGVDELWRWRYDIADEYYQKFWIQAVNWIGEAPFAVESPLIAIAADKLAYNEGDNAQLRVRLRDAQGRFINDADLRAVFLLDELEVAEIELEADEHGGGIYRGRSGALAPGDYQVVIRETGAETHDSTLSFLVAAAPNPELDVLTMNKPLLTTVSEQSGGQFVPEEQAGSILERLAAIDRREVITTDTILWSSYWWFVPIIILLTIEWILRKRIGYV